MFVRAVDIAADVLPGAPHVDHLIQFGQQLKDLAQRPPQTLAGLRHLEATFFTYWNETSGPHVNRFWQLVTDNDLSYARTDHGSANALGQRHERMPAYDLSGPLERPIGS